MTVNTGSTRRSTWDESGARAGVRGGEARTGEGQRGAWSMGAGLVGPVC
jgi:hypothetical protein